MTWWDEMWTSESCDPEGFVAPRPTVNGVVSVTTNATETGEWVRLS